MRQVIEGSLRAGETVTRTAERLLDADLPAVELPQYVRELVAAAKFPRGPGDVNLYEQAVARWSSTIERLGQGAGEAGAFTIRSATQRLVDELRTAKPEQLDRIVNRWVLERARYQARVVGRHESVEAFRDAELDAFRDQPWVKGVRWTLSPAHPRPDICDLLANQDLHGLGPGGYPLDAVPERHTSCLCQLSPITDDAHFDRELAKAKGEPEPPRGWESGQRVTGDEWLRQQSESMRVAVAGRTRARLIMQGRSVMDGDGRFKPVYQLLRRPKPDIHRGPTVDASGIVKADRESMVRPFPALPGKATKATKPTRTPKPKNRAPKPQTASQRPTKPAPAPPPAPPPPQLLPQYGRAAPAAEALRRDMEARLRDVRQTVPLVQDRYEGTLPQSLVDHVHGTALEIQRTFGIQQTRPITAVTTLNRGSRHFTEATGGLMKWDGEMQLRIRPRDGANDIREVVIHEAIHTMGGTSGPAYRGAAAALEEIATEELTQSFVGGTTTVFHTDPAISMADVDAAVARAEVLPTALVRVRGAYPELRERFYAVVASATGEKDAERLSMLVRGALRRWKTRVYATEQEAVEGMLDALQPSSPNQREFYRRLISDGAAWKS